MQPSPTTSLLASASPRLRACTLSLHTSLFVALLALGACRDPKVTAYRVAKEPSAELPASKPIHSAPAAVPADAQPAMPTVGSGLAAQPAPAGTAPDPHALPTASGQALTWTAPATWQAKPGSAMRKGTYVLSGPDGATAELAISAFPGDVGGDVANVNRWRGQVGLGELSEPDALASIQRLEANGVKIGVVDAVDATTANAPHLLGAIVPVDGATWFFKLTGPDAVVAAQKTAFLEFLKTIKPTAQPTP